MGKVDQCLTLSWPSFQIVVALDRQACKRAFLRSLTKGYFVIHYTSLASQRLSELIVRL